MIFMKVSREMVRHKEDNLLDMRGYFDIIKLFDEEKK